MGSEGDGGGLTRREFLRATTAAGAGLAITPVVWGESTGKGQDAIGVALLGAGDWGGVLVEAMLASKESVRFRAVCDIWEKYKLRSAVRRLNRYPKYRKDHVKGYGDYREMLAKEGDRLDAVIIATPDFCHAEQTIACLEAGLHVYCEGPMATTAEDARRMVQAARRAGKRLQIGHQRRSDERHRFCLEKLVREAGLLGECTAGMCQWNRSAACERERQFNPRVAMDEAVLKGSGYESMREFVNWRKFRKFSAGPIVNRLTGQIDVYNWFLGAWPVAVTASGFKGYWRDWEWYDNVLAAFEYEVGEGRLPVHCQALSTNDYGRAFERFLGTEATLVLSAVARVAAVYQETERAYERLGEYVKKGYLEASADLCGSKMGKVQHDGMFMSAYIDPTYPVPPNLYFPKVGGACSEDALHGGAISRGMWWRSEQRHLENLFGAVRGEVELTCPGEVGYETAVTVLKVNEAVAAERRLVFGAGEFEVQEEG